MRSQRFMDACRLCWRHAEYQLGTQESESMSNNYEANRHYAQQKLQALQASAERERLLKSGTLPKPSLWQRFRVWLGRHAVPRPQEAPQPRPRKRLT
jgi:hypothetical protein